MHYQKWYSLAYPIDDLRTTVIGLSWVQYVEGLALARIAGLRKTTTGDSTDTYEFPKYLLGMVDRPQLQRSKHKRDWDVVYATAVRVAAGDGDGSDDSDESAVHYSDFLAAMSAHRLRERVLLTPPTPPSSAESATTASSATSNQEEKENGFMFSGRLLQQIRTAWYTYTRMQLLGNGDEKATREFSEVHNIRDLTRELEVLDLTSYNMPGTPSPPGSAGEERQGMIVSAFPQISFLMQYGATSYDIFLSLLYEGEHATISALQLHLKHSDRDQLQVAMAEVQELAHKVHTEEREGETRMKGEASNAHACPLRAVWEKELVEADSGSKHKYAFIKNEGSDKAALLSTFQHYDALARKAATTFVRWEQTQQTDKPGEGEAR